MCPTPEGLKWFFLFKRTLKDLTDKINEQYFGKETKAEKNAEVLIDFTKGHSEAFLLYDRMAQYLVAPPDEDLAKGWCIDEARIAVTKYILRKTQ